MIAKYLFFLILFIVILIHALQPWSRLNAAATFMSAEIPVHCFSLF